MASSPSEKETKLSPEMERRLAAIRRSNPTCADCPAKNPQWASFLLPLPCVDGIPRKLGVLCCLNCVQNHHFELGNERCTIKSLEMAHEWILDDIKVLEYSGNSFVNSILEANVVDFDKNLVVAPEEKEDKRRARFIKYKYKKRSYLDDVIFGIKPTPQSDKLGQGLTESATTMPLKSCLKTKPKSQARKRFQHLSFDTLEIHEFPLILGDNPHCKGVPLQLSWQPCKERVLDIDVFESTRGPRRPKRRWRMTVAAREVHLLSMGYSINDLFTVTEMGRKTRRERCDSFQNKKWDSFHVVVESAREKLSFTTIANRHIVSANQHIVSAKTA